MKIQKLAIAAVAGTIFLFLMDMVWYTMIMKDSMNMPDAREKPEMMWLVISYIIFAVAFAAIYGGWSGGSSKVNSGLNFGIWIGLMVGLSMSLMWYSLATTTTLHQALVESAYSIVKYILLGIIVAFATDHPRGANVNAT